jgi:hypothetical protein
MKAMPLPLSTSTDLSRRVLRAIHALGERTGEPSIQTLLALVPAPPAAVCAMLLALDEAGYVDGERLRLTMRGFAAVHAPRALAFERRAHGIGGVRKAVRGVA